MENDNENEDVRKKERMERKREKEHESLSSWLSLFGPCLYHHPTSTPQKRTIAYRMSHINPHIVPAQLWSLDTGLCLTTQSTLFVIWG